MHGSHVFVTHLFLDEMRIRKYAWKKEQIDLKGVYYSNIQKNCHCGTPIERSYARGEIQ